MPAITIDPNNLEDFGTPVSGLKVDDHRFVTVMPFARLMNLVRDPLQAANPKFREASSQLSDYYALHEEIQRAFDKGKKENAAAYAEYIINLHEGEHGDTPTIDLYTPQALPVLGPDGPDQKAKLIWVHGLTVAPYDGETQLAARFIAAQKREATKQMPVVVTITHGRPVEYARQCFHDRNAYQRRAPVGVAMAMDARDAFISVVREVEQKVAFAKGKIAWRSRQMPQKGGFIAAAPFVRTAVACFAHGIGGVQMSKAEMPEGIDAAELTKRAVIWFEKVLDKAGPYMQDREHYVASSPAIWAALGAMGKPLMETSAGDTASLRTLADSLAARLDHVDWRKGDNWVGIAVKSTPSGYSFAGGAKDSGSIAFKALNDSGDANYNRVRVPSAAAA
ncbi:hypothetical protein X731_16265 [Mesorhizobium sp. L2C054A000]|nr:DNA sulfur modification protein DndB [Mesorhizobium sp. L2C054A000]ESZ46243.1 hypothetical protein X731_16265 [Mesorhizobium sp. L2C054A000]